MVEDLVFIAVLFSAVGGAYWLYGAAAAFAGVAAWRHFRSASATGWLVGTAICLALAIPTHLAAVFVVPRIFAGAITG